jgi:hypothetical protein
MREKIEITETRQHNGLLLSTVFSGRYFHRLFVGYSRREARTLFRDYVKGQQ